MNELKNRLTEIQLLRNYYVIIIYLNTTFYQCLLKT